MSKNTFGGTGASLLIHELTDHSQRLVCELLVSEDQVILPPEFSKLLIDLKSKTQATERLDDFASSVGWGKIKELIAKTENLRAFFSNLDDAVGILHAAVDVAKKSKPSDVRDELSEAQSAAINLQKKLVNLSVGARYWIGEGNCNALEKLREDCVEALKILGSVGEYIGRSVSSGGSINYPTLHLAAYTADALRFHMGIKPTTTKGGLFERILEVVYEEATGKEHQSLHALVSRALKVEVTRNPDGTIIFDPQKPI